MNDQPIEIVRVSGNVLSDFGYPDADVRQAKTIIGAQIIKILDEEGCRRAKLNREPGFRAASSLGSAAHHA